MKNFISELKSVDINKLLANQEVIIGLDIGDKTIGIAVSDRRLKIASGVTTLSRNGSSKDFIKLKETLEKYKVGCVIFGWPVQMNGQPGPQCEKILKFIEDGKAPKDKTFSQFVAVLCNEKQHSLHNLYPSEMPPKPFPVTSLVIAAFQVLDNAKLVEGIKADLVPTLVKDKLTIDIHTDPANIKITERGKDYIKNASSACNMFSSAATYGPGFAKILVDEVAYIISLHKDK